MQITNPAVKGLEFETVGNHPGLASRNMRYNDPVVGRMLRRPATPRPVIPSNSMGLECLPAPERLLGLNEIAITQMRTLLADPNLKRLKP